MRFIQVGVGGFGTVWGRVLRENRDAQVVGLADVSDDALRKACEAGGYGSDICFKSLKDALRKVKADAVVLSTPPAFHRQDVVAAMKAGLDVICEKPMADSLAACKAMLKAALETGRTCVVSQNYRYAPPMWTLAAAMRSGELGAIGQAKLDFFMGVDFHGGFRHAMPYPVIVDMSIHHFDLIRFVTGLDAVGVSGAAWNPPWSNYKGDCSSTALFEMNNGARILYNASWCAKGAFCDWNANWQVECEKGTVTYRQGEIRVHRVPGLYKIEKTEVLPHTALPLTGQHYVLDEFMRCVKERRRPSTAVQDNIRSVAMVFAAVKALRSGRKTEVLDKGTLALLERARGGGGAGN
ncbi:MAG: Gfo/Idh/MocA family oxidoreductase [Lentisphaerae bacterium]|nr:Gfo/Idh/MocA family oxidoreductase [Lentisphaerota bacterium]